ncbi:hypothetical protein [Bifidobacterium bifidum]|uniref:hypothetical protein n=1 Tax=Bifidobacterium bifidum TaxID=1681 RepID=UPI001F00B8F0|nr:hypothetical protein [Bifidobacterium bifidum]
MRKDRLLTHNAKQRIWTSAGGSICLDLCIALLAEHAGQSLATAEANMLMMHYPPFGGHPAQRRRSIRLAATVPAE